MDGGGGKSKTSVIKYSVEFNDFAEPSVSVEDSIWKTVSSEDSIFGRQYLTPIPYAINMRARSVL